MAAGFGNYQLPHPPLEPKTKSLFAKRQKKRINKTKMDIEPEELGLRIGSMGIKTVGMGLRTGGKRLKTDGKGLKTDGTCLDKQIVDEIDLNFDLLKVC